MINIFCHTLGVLHFYAYLCRNVEHFVFYKRLYFGYYLPYH